MCIILDKSLPYANIIMKLSDFSRHSPMRLPDGFYFKRYQPSDRSEWAAIEAECLEFDSADDALAAFDKRYNGMEKQLAEGLFFVLNSDGEYCGTCMAWRDKDPRGYVNALHWLAVRPKFRSLGLSKALISETVRLLGTAEPIYLHTQTWSYKAVYIYTQMGFDILKTETFAHYINEYEKAMSIIKPALSPERYNTILKRAK